MLHFHTQPGTYDCSSLECHPRPPRWFFPLCCQTGRTQKLIRVVFAGSASYPSAVLSAPLSSASPRLLAKPTELSRATVQKVPASSAHYKQHHGSSRRGSLSAPAATARARASTSGATRVTPRHRRPVPCQARPRRRHPRGAAGPGRAGPGSTARSGPWVLL